MVEPVEAADILRSRLVQAAPFLLPGRDVTALSVGDLLSDIARAVWLDPSDSRLWLALAVTTGSLPEPADVHRLRRSMTSSGRLDAMNSLLAIAVHPVSVDGLVHSRVRVVSDRPVVDVDFCARHGHNSGIQRVVRETVPRWAKSGREFQLVAWTVEGSAMRELAAEEETRVLAWTSDRRREASPDEFDDGAVLIIPWQTTVILPEVAREHFTSRLAALAQFSGNRVSAVGYDTIPIVSAHDVPYSEANRFAKYLYAIKYVDRVLSISRSAGEEFAGFSSALAAQGVVGPVIAAVPLPVDTVGARFVPTAPDPDAQPLILSVGTQEPRKNQISLLFAAERLWREGYRFELMFIGGADLVLARDFDALAERLAAAGRSVTVHRHATDELLQAAYSRARFSAFISLHEGFGLPVGESLAYGTPVLASNFGSVAEVAVDGGCVLVDPRDDEDILAGMRRMLDDDELIRDLIVQAGNRVPRTWDDYADELWAATLVDTLEDTL